MHIFLPCQTTICTRWVNPKWGTKKLIFPCGSDLHVRFMISGGTDLLDIDNCSFSIGFFDMILLCRGGKRKKLAQAKQCIHKLRPEKQMQLQMYSFMMWEQYQCVRVIIVVRILMLKERLKKWNPSTFVCRVWLDLRGMRNNSGGWKITKWEKGGSMCMPTNMTLSACFCVFLSDSNDMI